jgi:DNA-binding transcriptional MerR regulator
MKPLGFSLEEMRQLLTLLDDLDAGGADRAALLDRLRMFHEAALARVRALEEQLHVAEGLRRDARRSPRHLSRAASTSEW